MSCGRDSGGNSGHNNSKLLLSAPVCIKSEQVNQPICRLTELVGLVTEQKWETESNHTKSSLVEEMNAKVDEVEEQLLGENGTVPIAKAQSMKVMSPSRVTEKKCEEKQQQRDDDESHAISTNGSDNCHNNKKQHFLLPSFSADVDFEYLKLQAFLKQAAGDEAINGLPSGYIKATWFVIMQYLFCTVSQSKDLLDSKSSLLDNGESDEVDDDDKRIAALAPVVVDMVVTDGGSAAAGSCPTSVNYEDGDLQSKVVNVNSDSSSLSSLSGKANKASKARGGRKSKKVLPQQLRCDPASTRKFFALEVIPHLFYLQETARSSKRDKFSRIDICLDAKIPTCDGVGCFGQPLETILSVDQRALALLFNPLKVIKTDRRRKVLSQTFLYCLRHFFPVKYTSAESFLSNYNSFRDRSPKEIDRLKMCANWMDLILFTIKPENNKSFLVSYVPHLSEGHAAKFITGSGESKRTADRVFVFRTEGNVSKIPREPRMRRSKRKQFDTDVNQDVDLLVPALKKPEAYPVSKMAATKAKVEFEDYIAGAALQNMLRPRQGSSTGIPWGDLDIESDGSHSRGNSIPNAIGLSPIFTNNELESPVMSILLQSGHGNGKCTSQGDAAGAHLGNNCFLNRPALQISNLKRLSIAGKCSARLKMFTSYDEEKASRSEEQPFTFYHQSTSNPTNINDGSTDETDEETSATSGSSETSPMDTPDLFELASRAAEIVDML